MSDWNERVISLQCTRCSRSATPDSPYCPEHLASEVERVRLAMRKLRADRKLSRVCAWCPNRSGKRRLCKTCRRKRRGSVVTAPTPIVTQPAQIPRAVTRAARIAARTWIDSEGRTRHHGKARKGPPTASETDAWDLRTLRAELELAAAAVDTSHSPEVAAMPRIQRDAIVRDALSHLGLMERQLEELVDRLKRRLR